MGFLRTNYDDVNAGFAPLPIGEYECIISEVKVENSSNGNPMLRMTLTVRDDVEQAGQKRKFFDNCVEMESMMWKFQQIAKAAQLPVGEDYPTLADFAGAIQYQAVRIKNKHEMYQGEPQDRVAWFAEPKVEGGTGAGENYSGDPFANNGKAIDIGDDDLPF